MPLLLPACELLRFCCELEQRSRPGNGFETMRLALEVSSIFAALIVGYALGALRQARRQLRDLQLGLDTIRKARAAQQVEAAFRRTTQTRQDSPGREISRGPRVP